MKSNLEFGDVISFQKSIPLSKFFYTGCSKKGRNVNCNIFTDFRICHTYSIYFKEDHQEICYANFQVLGFLENNFSGKRVFLLFSKIFRTRLVSCFCWDGSNFLHQGFIFMSYIEYLLRRVIMLSMLCKQVSLSQYVKSKVFLKMPFSLQEKAQILHEYIRTGSITTTQRWVHRVFRKNRPTRNDILRCYANFMSDGNLGHRGSNGRPRLADERIEEVRQMFAADPHLIIRRTSTVLGMPPTTVHRILR